jgi:phosphoribosyl 1,2-cyclic phosphodiesterase
MTRPPNSAEGPRVRFWGVRGSTPTPVPANMRFGGNTACVEVDTGGPDLIVFDAGTGLRLLGDRLLAESEGRGYRPVHILLSHLHWDHIQGFPFFRPVYTEGYPITVSGSSSATRLLKPAFEGQLSDPYFPVLFRDLPARVELRDLPEHPFDLPCGRLSTAGLHHPQGATAFRLDCGAKSVVYACDHEHGNGSADAALVELARNADLLISDAQYTPQEYEYLYRGWGHSTWVEVAKLAQRANVKQLVMTHHDPWHDDAALDEIESLAQRQFAGTRLAREGMEILL